MAGSRSSAGVYASSVRRAACGPPDRGRWRTPPSSRTSRRKAVPPARRPPTRNAPEARNRVDHAAAVQRPVVLEHGGLQVLASAIVEQPRAVRIVRIAHAPGRPVARQVRRGRRRQEQRNARARIARRGGIRGGRRKMPDDRARPPRDDLQCHPGGHIRAHGIVEPFERDGRRPVTTAHVLFAQFYGAQKGGGMNRPVRLEARHACNHGRAQLRCLTRWTMSPAKSDISAGMYFAPGPRIRTQQPRASGHR